VSLGIRPRFSSRLLTHSNEAELELQSERSYRAVKEEKLAHPTRFERVTLPSEGKRLGLPIAEQPCCPASTEIEGLGQYLDEPPWIPRKDWRQNASFRA